MAVRKKGVLELAHPNAAGIDIGSASHYVAVPPERDDEPVREFKSFTEDMERLADWLAACGVDTVAMESTGVYWIPLFMYSQGLDVDDLEMDAESYKGTAQYARAKRAQVELLGLWAERLAPTAVVHAMHPGWADTPGVEAGLPTFRK